jgi:hypothetical protein
MAGPVVFEKIDKVLPLWSGQFEAIFRYALRGMHRVSGQ